MRFFPLILLCFMPSMWAAGCSAPTSLEDQARLQELKRVNEEQAAAIQALSEEIERLNDQLDRAYAEGLFRK